MTQAHLNCLILATIPGILLHAAGMAAGWAPPEAAPLFYAASTTLLAWPAMRFLNVPPILRSCPQCGSRRTWVALSPVRAGVTLKCSVCGRTSLLLCRWIDIGPELIRRFDGPLIAALLDERGEATACRRARWPHFVVLWKTVDCQAWVSDAIGQDGLDPLVTL